MTYKKHEVEWTQEKAARVWGYYASNKSYASQYFGAQSGKYVAQLINKELGFSNLQKILDFSCGLGDLIDRCLPYLKDGQQIYGTDHSQDNVDITNNRFSDNNVFVEANYVRDYPCKYSGGSFDLIILTEVIEHLTDEELDIVLKEILRLLKKGGYLFITTPNDEDYDANKVHCPDCGCTFHRWQHLRTWNTATLKHKMEQYPWATTLVRPIAWASTAGKLASLLILKPVAKNGLFYIGKKT
jgi:2-polyprenyl-3-methyl-5-hydroxy-6-metoxy-1,4-benzoquinol methylase